MQALPLEAKIRMTKERIRAWYDYWDGMVYVSFSGGKDSTVLKHIVDSMYDDVPAVFVNTGLEYPEIQLFVKAIKEGKYPCFNTDVVILRPEMRFDQVIKEKGYPVISKEVSARIDAAKKGKLWGQNAMKGLNPDGTECEYKKRYKKYQYLIDAPFKVSNECCHIMKKKPAKKYERETDRKPFVGMMACESTVRAQSWMKTGCNSFDGSKAKSTPLAFWTDQDILEYILKYDVPYAPVYGSIKEEGELDGQMFIDGFHQKLTTTGMKRTGCMFCMFGCHLDKLGDNKDKNRFQLMKETHPNQYEYCMKTVEDGGLGIRTVLEYIGVPWE